MQLWKNIKPELKYEIIGIILLGFSVLTGVGLYWEYTGYPFIYGKTVGTLGMFLIRIMNGFTGEGKYLLPLLFAFMAFKLIKERKMDTTGTARWIGVVLALFMFLGIKHMAYVNTDSFWLIIKKATLNGVGGGMLGSIIAIIFYKIFGLIGSYIVFATVFIISFLLITNLHIIDVIKKIYFIILNFLKKLTKETCNYITQEVDESEKKKKKKKKYKKQKNEPVVKVFNENNETKTDKENIENNDNVSFNSLNENMNFNINDKDDYNLPPITLLKRNLKLNNPRMSKDISEKVKMLEETLVSFGINSKVSEVSCGPAITRYEVQPNTGTKVSKIVNLADDIALNLAASDVRIEAPIPGKAAVGIEVPNKEISVVHFREVLDSKEFNNSKSSLNVALGMDIAGNAVIADLSKMPHLLIAGATGSGKSVCMNALICSLLYKCNPNELKLLIIDPKMVELTNFNDIPHLITPVVTDPKKAATALRWMVNEMENRYELFAASGVKDINRYNSLKINNDSDDPKPFLPYIVVLIDELADLMMVAPADIEDAICRLAQMARAAGIHLVVATQRPSVDVITGLIKANIPSRIAFAVSSQTDSRTILDMGGAEKLLGQGDMLFFPVGASKPLRVQGVYVSDKEVENIVEFLKSQAKPEYEDGLFENKSGKSKEIKYEDELLPEAVRILIESGQASISMLQRRLRIGYTRAARLIDIMEEKKIVGGYEGSKPRSVLIGWEEYKELFGDL